MVLLIPALINGYPLIYSDTSTYLASGFTLQPPMDRPITYGLFMRLFSLNGITMWTVIFIQSYILSYLIYQMVHWIFGENQKFLNYIFIAAVATASFSGAGWTSVHLIPDIFTPIMLLSAILVLFSRPDRGKKYLYYLVYGVSAAMHSSHIPFGIALLSTILVTRIFLTENNRSFIKVRPVLILIGITMATILTMGSSLSKSKHVFLMGAFVEQGIVHAYLDQHCATHDYNLCAYKDSLPGHAWEFIWQESSPLYKLGGWKETKEEFNAIIMGTFSSPRFIWLHVAASFKATMKQLIKFESVDPYGVAPNAAQLHSRVERYVPHDLNRFENSRQNLRLLGNLIWINHVQALLVLLSLISIVLFYSLFKSVRSNPELMLTGALILMGILINAWVCGTFANPVDRLGSKMIWLIPLYALIILFRVKSNTPENTT